MMSFDYERCWRLNSRQTLIVVEKIITFIDRHKKNNFNDLCVLCLLILLFYSFRLLNNILINVLRILNLILWFQRQNRMTLIFIGRPPSPKHKQLNFLIIYIFNWFSPFSYDFYSKWTKENDTRLIKKIVSEFNKEKRIICTVYFAFK